MTTTLERAWRDERHVVLATVVRRLGDLEVADEAVQEAFARAARRWPVDGEPDRPGAWLTTTAHRAGLDILRRRRRHVAFRDDLAGPRVVPDDPGEAPDPHADDLLVLVVTCCHPALPVEARVALTLRHVCGLGVPEVAAGFLVSEAAMAKRLVRARRKIRDAGIAFEVPAPSSLPRRLADAREVAYLVFTEGHQASVDGPAVRPSLCDDAIWLARQVRTLRPDPESDGLLALMLLHHARADARLDSAGRLVALPEQSRAAWDHDAIAEAREVLAGTGRTSPGRFQVEAAIALQHTLPDGPDWAVVADLYGLLVQLHPTPVVVANRALAVGRAAGPGAGLAVLEPVRRDLADHVVLHAVEADLLEAGGDRAGAAVAWGRAADLAPHPAQRAHLRGRARAVSLGR